MRSRCAERAVGYRAEAALSIGQHMRLGGIAVVLAAVGVGGCTSMSQIDRRVEWLMQDAAHRINAGDIAPSTAGVGTQEPNLLATDPNPDPNVENPETVNPTAESLTFKQLDRADIEQTSEIIERLERYQRQSSDDALELDLEAALAYAQQHSREYRFAEEDFILQSLRTLIERHQWGPRFFNDVSADFNANGDNGLFDSSVSLVNDLRVTQRLPYGGEVSARALARATEDLHQFVAGERTNSMDIILDADLPLLRGAGLTARESLIQANRNLVYAARDFERFRREFLVDISRDFLGLVVQQRQIENAERQVETLRLVADAEEANYRAGRRAPFEAAEAQNALFDGQDSLNGARESYRLSIDRFKVRLGMGVDDNIIIKPSTLRLPIPDVTTQEAVQRALQYRLDLQTQRDGIDDARRSVNNAKNDLLPDLDLSASVTMPTNSDRGREIADFEPDDTDFSVGLNFSVPLDRDIEKYSLRDAQIGYERRVRGFDEFRDNIIVSVRAAVRTIDRTLLSLDIQKQNVTFAMVRQRSIEADPDRADVRQKTEAANQLQSNRDALNSAVRDLEIAILDYLLATGQLRVDQAGRIRPLENMQFTDELSEYISEVMQDAEVDPADIDSVDPADRPTLPGVDQGQGDAADGDSGDSGDDSSSGNG